MPIRLRGGGGGSAPPAEAVATRNILNGVLNCAWDKTSAVPKLLEIYDTSKVKLNIDADNPLTLAFANGWDDKDRPAQVIKTLATAPANIDLSAKANCHVQIVAKIINGELVITTYDVFDPNWSTFADIVPTFPAIDSSPVNGWSLSASDQKAGNEIFKFHNGNNGDYWMLNTGFTTAYCYVTPPNPFALVKFTASGYTGNIFRVDARNETYESWTTLGSVTSPSTGGNASVVMTSPESLLPYAYYRIYLSGGSSYRGYFFNFCERPLVQFNKALNQVKDVGDNVVTWINLGYATVDASGNITALNHYTDLRNNFPGGMRVEA